jgi:sodium-dependent phosphate cotransporter
MGANIGTTVTNTLVALGHITRKEEFKRALSGSTIHDFFNILTVIILFPIEMSTRYLERAGTALSQVFRNMGGVKFTSPVKVIVKPAVKLIHNVIESLFRVEGVVLYIILLVLAIVLLFLALYFIVKVMRSLVARKADMVFNKVIGKNVILSMFMGMLFTAIVQSSSITTSILVPLVAAGVLEIEHSFPIVLGANIGTTVTAILASFTGNITGITVAFVHLVFNITGILIIYPIRLLRNVPLKAARFIAEKCAARRRYAFIYVLGTFYFIPITLVLMSRLIGK